MRHCDGKRAIVSVSNFRKLRCSKGLHCIDNGKSVDNARQIESNGAHRDRQCNGEQSFKNRFLGAYRFSDHCNYSTIFLGVLIMKELRNQQKKHSHANADRNTGNRISRSNFNAFSSINSIISKNDTNHKFTDRFRNLTNCRWYHISMTLEISPHGAGQTNEK